MPDEFEPLTEEHTVCIGRYPTPAQANDDTLLILSMGQPYWMNPTENGFELRVPAEAASDILEQLKRSREENRFWPPLTRLKSTKGEDLSFQWYWIFPYVLLLILLFVGQQYWGAEFTESGRLDSQGIVIQNQWWRVITALTLHADVSHLLGNLGMGGFFALFVVHRFGMRLGWMLVLLSGMLGNVMNAYLHSGDPFYAIGASTAVFAAVGILAGADMWDRIRLGSLPQMKTRNLVVPLLVALMVLAWWGTSGQNTDIFGHLLGLIAGIFVGLGSNAMRLTETKWIQWPAAFFTMILLITVWLFAFFYS